jgi:putative hydrolase of the HAD superfamily
MSERLGLPSQQVPYLRKKYFETYGTTLRGLQLHHQVDVDEYLAYVHDLPLEKFIQADPNLRRLLLSLPQQRWIFTNADVNHARRVLGILGLTDCFMGIIDIRAVHFACKPEPQAYQQAMTLAGEFDPQRCVMLDDSPRNLAPAHTLGFTTILVGLTESPDQVASYHVPSLLALPDTVPGLWESDE